MVLLLWWKHALEPELEPEPKLLSAKLQPVKITHGTRRALCGRALRGPLEVCIATQLLVARTAPEALWKQPEWQKHWWWRGRS